MFKGGTCLKKCYIETYRFSEDLDFTVLPGGPFRVLLAELESEWNNMLGHQLPALPPLAPFLGELPSLFAWQPGPACRTRRRKRTPHLPGGEDSGAAHHDETVPSAVPHRVLCTRTSACPAAIQDSRLPRWLQIAFVLD